MAERRGARFSENAGVMSMAIDIETLFTNINGTAPNPKSLAKIKEAGLQLRLEDHDAFWLILIAFEGQQSEVAKAMSATTDLAFMATKAAVETNEGAAAIRKIMEEGAPSLAKTIQEVALNVSDELTGAIGDAAGKGATAIVTGMQNAAADARSVVSIDVIKAGRQATAEIKTAAAAAISALGEARNELQNEAKLVGTRTLLNWTDAVDIAVEKQMLRKSETEIILQRQRTFQTIIITLLVTLAGFIGTGMIANRMGYRTGYAEGEQANFDASARAAWGNSKEGQIAYLLAQAENIENLATCARPGWKVEQRGTQRVCIPREAEKTLYGWGIP
jgi:hypothetical protein